MKLRSTHLAVFVTLLGVLLGAGYPVFAQSGSNSDSIYRTNNSEPENVPSGRTHAVDERESSAEKEAERLVSLPAERIIVLLEREPGLFLQVKKMLVRKAYKEGRLLDPKELTDEALYRLIRSDENIRVLVTNEIEDRNYIRVKPSQEELERRRTWNANAKTNAESGTSGLYGASQEDEYWSQQQRKSQGQPSAEPPASRMPDVPQSPQGAPTDDARRKVLQAQAQAYEDSSDGLPLDVLGGMPQVSPDQLAQMLNARNKASGAASGGSASDAELSNISLTPGTNPRVPTNAGTMNGPMPNFRESNDAPAVPSAGIGTLRSPMSSRGMWGLRNDQPVLAHSPNPYADVPSLYDLGCARARVDRCVVHAFPGRSWETASPMPADGDAGASLLSRKLGIGPFIVPAFVGTLGLVPGVRLILLSSASLGDTTGGA